MGGRASRARPASNTATWATRSAPCAASPLEENIIRQILLAHSDVDRSYSYAFSGAAPFPVRDYTASIRVVPVMADGRSFVEWWATFDCAAEERDKWVNHFEQEGFAKWLAALARFMADGAIRT